MNFIAVRAIVAGIPKKDTAESVYQFTDSVTPVRSPVTLTAISEASPCKAEINSDFIKLPLLYIAMSTAEMKIISTTAASIILLCSVRLVFRTAC